MKLSLPKVNFANMHFIKGTKEIFGVKPDRNKSDFFVIFAIFMIFFAFIICSFLTSVLNKMALNASFELADSVAIRTASATAEISKGDVFTEANLFSSVIRSSDGEESSAESFVLRGTLPRIGAWISTGGDAKLVLVRQEIAGWTLEDVSYGKVLLSKDGDNSALYMSYSDGNGQGNSSHKGENKSEKLDFSAVRRAEKDKEGFMPRELLDKLLMNPYDEVGKMRMTPADSGGMKVENIESDSVLGVAGVQQGDVIKAINGVSISNLGDLTNAINSMLAGTRFDVTVQRGSADLALKYSVN